MNKYYWIGTVIFAIVSLFTMVFYYNYVNDFKEKEKVILAEIENKQNRNKAIVNDNKDKENIVQVNNEDSRVSDTTEYLLTEIDLATGKIVTRMQPMPSELVGLSKEEIQEYLITYLDNMSTADMEKGLHSIQLTSFSPVEIRISKSYNSELPIFQYYIKVENNIIMVYERDRTTLFENTGIDVSGLPQEELELLVNGIEVKDKDELMSILESYSS